MRKFLPGFVGGLVAALLISGGPALAQLEQTFGMGDSTVTGNLTVNGSSTTTGASSATAYTATSSSQFNTSLATATMLFTSATNDATTSATVGPYTFKAGANITATDLLFDVQDSSANHAFKVTEAGNATALLEMNTPSLNVTDGTNGNSLNVAQGGYVGFSGDATYDSAGTSLRCSGGFQLLVNNAGHADYVFDATGLWVNGVSRSLGKSGAVWTGGLWGATDMRGTCTLNGATPATCTATVVAGAKCTCSNVGATAVIAALGCAVGVSGTTLTITSGASATHDVNYVCIN